MKKIYKYLFILLFILMCFFSLQNRAFAAVDENNIRCAALDNANIDIQLPKITKTVILVLQIAVPIILIIFGSIDLIKGVMAQKEDEIAAGRKTFLKRFVSAIIVFFVIAAVKVVVSIGTNTGFSDIFNCAECFIKGPDSKGCQEA